MRAGRAFLDRMIERVFATMVRGPALNCRPHNSRQRLDLTRLSVFEGGELPILPRLLADRRVDLGVLPEPPRFEEDAEPKDAEAEDGPERTRADTHAEARERWADQQAVYAKLRIIAEDALTWERDTGTPALFVGLPLLSLPGAARRGGAGRVLAPVALIPVRLSIKTGRRPSVRLEAIGEGADLLVPNAALLAWIEQETRTPFPELDAEELDPWRELDTMLARVAGALQIDAPAFSADTPVRPTPRSDAKIGATLLPCAVLGLFPTTGQAVLRDLEAIRDGEELEGPVNSFLDVQTSLTTDQDAPEHVLGGRGPSAEERLVAQADPCQAHAVRLARSSRGLVVHGPPGTGKSQTITNVVGDHLARGERVLLVCDKRTALDVVQHRLTALGLGGLVAVVHDVTRDRTELYKDVREQLEGLAERKTDPVALDRLAAVDAELDALYGELSANDAALSEGGDRSFHHLVGDWLALPPTPELTEALAPLSAADLDTLDAHALGTREVYDRAAGVGWTDNPWRDAVGLSLGALLAAPPDHWRAPLDAARAEADRLDATLHPWIQPFPASPAPSQVGKARVELADLLAVAARGLDPADLARLFDADLTDTRVQLDAAEPHLRALAAPLDGELALAARETPVDPVQIPAQLAVLHSWLDVARAWYGFVFFWRASAARLVLTRLGLPLAPKAAERTRDFLLGVRSRRIVGRLFEDLGLAAAPDDATLRRRAEGIAALIQARALLATPALVHEAEIIGLALRDPPASRFDGVLDGLRASGPRGAALDTFAGALDAVPLLAAPARAALFTAVRTGSPAAPPLDAFLANLGTVEGVVRVHDRLASLAPPLAASLRRLLDAGVSASIGEPAMRRAVLAAELGARLRSSPTLATIDATRAQTCFTRVETLELQKRTLVRDAVVHRWVSRQRERLLAGTGSRLNPVGAALRRRLGLRGEKAMRLRQCLVAGQGVDGGDPLYDLKPIWMASPETVATLFERAPLFDIVIFDEASQCRLEEAVGVLARARRVLVAGDPKQLPPTRFFESALVASEAEEPESDQALFETQQSEVEDLLGAALNLEIEQSFLDVHYRSSNADLIEFSNQHFYGSRLQAIPGHPKNRTRVPPISLHEVLGIYEDRANLCEAFAVVDLVRELLAQEHPPSIGIACFNLAQRDTILEALDDAAADDPDFSEQLALARGRRSAASFDGLFVKNLENVQGDERDHMIISTTYGPAPNGKFYRRFGPLAMPGGGRRLNVLVTRARRRVHLVTSIPRDQWASLAPVPEGQTPTGGWLLFGYLRYADRLAHLYADDTQQVTTREVDEIVVRATRTPSRLSEALADQVKSSVDLGSTVYWGNDGFCVDVALRSPEDADGVTVGVLLDGARFDKAADRVEWDIFRTGILRGQGWELVRLWSPNLFREPEAALEAVTARVAQPAVN